MSERELRLEPSVALVVAGKRLTPRQLEVLKAVYEEGSQNKAAQRLGISTPVLHRYLAQIEGKIGAPLTSAGPTGTRLNQEGERIALEHIALSRRMDRGRGTVVGGTVVSEELLLSALTNADPEGSVDLIISDDERNLQDFQAGLMDLVMLDDPLYLFELEDIKWQEIVEDRLVHVDRGPRYVRFKYGAQRIGFRHLESRSVPYTVERTYRSLSAMLDSGLSFFVNESLLLRRGIHLKSATEPSMLAHELTAVYRKETPKVRKVVNELRKQARVL